MVRTSPDRLFFGIIATTQCLYGIFSVAFIEFSSLFPRKYVSILNSSQSYFDLNANNDSVHVGERSGYHMDSIAKGR